MDRLSSDQMPSAGFMSGAYSRQPVDAQPVLVLRGELRELRREMNIEVVPAPDQRRGQLAVGGDDQVPVIGPGEPLRLALSGTSLTLSSPSTDPAGLTVRARSEARPGTRAANLPTWDVLEGRGRSENPFKSGPYRQP